MARNPIKQVFSVKNSTFKINLTKAQEKYRNPNIFSFLLMAFSFIIDLNYHYKSMLPAVHGAMGCGQKALR